MVYLGSTHLIGEKWAVKMYGVSGYWQHLNAAMAVNIMNGNP